MTTEKDDAFGDGVVELLSFIKSDQLDFNSLRGSPIGRRVLGNIKGMVLQSPNEDLLAALNDPIDVPKESVVDLIRESTGSKRGYRERS